MENENKEKVILTDEQLKEVVGGASACDKLAAEYFCNKIMSSKKCILETQKKCAWIGNKCVANPNL